MLLKRKNAKGYSLGLVYVVDIGQRKIVSKCSLAENQGVLIVC